VALFGGAVIKDKRFAFLLPLLAQFASDLYFQLFTSTPGFYDISQFFVYSSMALVTLLGTRMGEPKATKVLGFAFTGSALFFLLSNLGVFFTGMYGYSIQGLVRTYVMAIPFYQNTLIGDLVFSSILFGGFALAKRSLPLQPARLKA
jgi:hypothetical protein